MNPKDLMRLQQLLKTLKVLQGQQHILRWLRENKDTLRRLTPEDLEMLRERVDYDREAWRSIVQELLGEK